jgi:hypothetical protein
MRPKRGESGQSLILTICVISLGVSIILYALLSGTATSRENARLATSKIDVSQREDLLMRSILHKFVEGFMSAQTWDTILNNALSEVRASTLINPADLTTLFPGQNIIPANLADSNAGVSILIPGFTGPGFSGLIAFAGTNISNVDSGDPAKPGTLPPILQYGSLPGQETVDRLLGQDPVTIPQYMFFRSAYPNTSSSVPSLSPSNRWGQLSYPNIRFGLEHPGDPLVARRIWWRIPVQYTSSFGGYTGNRQGYASQTVNYILSIYEIPSQLPITGNGNIQLGVNSDGSSWGNTTSTSNQVQITGSIYGDQVQVNGGTYSGRISSRNQVSIAQASSVSGENFSDSTYNNLGVREQKDLTRTVGGAPVSVAGDNGKVLLVPLLPGQDFLLPATGSYLPATPPTAWDLYARPYFHCRIRILISGTLSDPNSDGTKQFNYSGGQINTSGNTGAITVTISYLPDTAGLADAVFGVADSAFGTPKVYQQTNNLGGTGNLGSNGVLQTIQNGIAVNSNFLTYTSTNTGNPATDANILEIDLLNLISTLGLIPSQAYSIYIGCAPSQNPNNLAPQNLGIAITDAANLSAFTNGLSIVTTQRLYLVGDFNNTGVPTSLYAKDLRYGIDGLPAQLNLTGQVSISQVAQNSSTAVNPLSFVNGANALITGAGNTYKLNAITSPNGIPPITRLNLLFTIDEERTN